jgi:hypothetical protein
MHNTYDLLVAAKGLAINNPTHPDHPPMPLLITYNMTTSARPGPDRPTAVTAVGP